jgi:hypothetical protein
MFTLSAYCSCSVRYFALLSVNTMAITMAMANILRDKCRAQKRTQRQQLKQGQDRAAAVNAGHAAEECRPHGQRQRERQAAQGHMHRPDRDTLQPTLSDRCQS